MQLTLGNKVEEWAIYALRTFATLAADLQITASALSEETKAERLVVKCEVGPQMQEAIRPFQCHLSFDFHTTNRSAEEANDVFAKVEAALKEALSNAASIAYATAQGFKWLQVFTEEAESTVDNSGNFRKYTRTIPIRALTS